MPMIENFAHRLTKLRAERGFSKSSLARAVGVTTTCVWNWEAGNTQPRPGSLAKVASVLGTSREFLQRGVKPPEGNGTGIENLVVREDPPAQSKQTVAEVVLSARHQIATAAGLSLERVRVILEYAN